MTKPKRPTKDDTIADLQKEVAALKKERWHLKLDIENLRSRLQLERDERLFASIQRHRIANRNAWGRA